MGYFCDIEAKVKECSRCRIVLPFDAFYPDKSKRGGRMAYCKACKSLHGKAGYTPRGGPVFCDTEQRVKECRVCKIVLPFDDFYGNPTASGGVTSKCKKCILAFQKGKRTPEQRRKWHLARKFSLTPEDYVEMLDSQDGICIICENPMDKPHIDHCHATGKVRGLLCHSCNLGLGHFKENTGSLIRALDYLNHHKGND